MRIRAFAILGCAAALGACSTTGNTGSAKSADASDTADTPYASTYKAYPGAPTALVGATIYDGAGGRIDNGTVLFAGGKVVPWAGPTCRSRQTIPGSMAAENSSPPV